MSAALTSRAIPLGLAALGVAGYVGARHLDLWTDDGPGSGLLPKVALALVASLARLVALFPSPSPDTAAEGTETPRTFAIYAAVTVALAVTVPLLGFILPTLVGTAIVMRFAEDRSCGVSVLYAILLVATIVLTFGTALKVQFPDGPAEAVLKSLRLL